MRLLHTSDWHIGRTIEGRDRHSEHEEFFEELSRIAQDEKADAVLMAGDVFDSVNPAAKSEELFYESMSEISRGGELPIIIISGNHDHPARLSAAKSFLYKHNVHIQGHPTLSPFKIPVKGSSSILNVAGLPYPSESRLKESFSEDIDDIVMRDAYDEKIKGIFEELTSTFSEKDVNIAMSHLYVAGGAGSESERPIEVGGAYTVRATHLPANVQYTALGHLHRPQEVKRAPVLAKYAGSPLSFSFSETGYTKSVTMVDVEPCSSAHIKDIPLSCGKPLVRWHAESGLAQVRAWMDEKRDSDAWIELDVHMTDAPSMNDIQQLKQAYPGLLTIRPVYPEEERETIEKRKHVPIDKLFNQFYERQTGGALPDEELTKLFLEIVSESGENTG